MRGVKLGIAMLFRVFQWAEAAWGWLVRRPVGSVFVVLMYHSVKDAERERFARQMDLLARLACPVPADFVDTGGMRHGRAYVAVTFDDGYRSVLDNAVPVLLRKGIPAALFVPTGYLGRTPAWITDAKSRDRNEALLSTDEVKLLRKNGLLIGAHGATHRPLAELSRADALAELTGPREVLEDLLGKEIRLFALPYGSSSPDVLGLTKEAGYERVFLGDPLGTRANVDGHVSGRIGVTPTDWPLEFRLKIRGAYQWLPVAIAAKARVADFFRGQWFAPRPTRRRSA
jgi:peptidoglycan/xylan/chitin deacetylase (PgdA/CDA1 family)